MSVAQLIIACTKGDIAAIERLLDDGVNPCGIALDNEIPFLVAAEYGLLPAIKLFVKYGANPHIALGNYERYIVPPLDSKIGWNALFFAVFNRHYDTAQYLLTELQLNPNTQDVWGRTPFMFAAQNGDVPMLRLLVQHGANPMIVDQLRQNVIHHATENLRYRAVQYLITELNINADTPADHNKTPFIIAASKGDVKMLRLLAQLGADPHATDCQGKNALHYAIQNRHDNRRDAVECLITQFHLDPNSQDHQGITPFMIAAERGDIDMLKHLIQLGANPHATDQNGRNALYYAIKNRQLHVIRYLIIRLGLDPNSRDHQGITPFMFAVSNGDIDMLKLLIQFNANPYAIDHKGRNALHFASKRGTTTMIQFLVNHLHLDPQQQDGHGNTPLLLAMKKQNILIARTLTRLGADPHIPNHQGQTPAGIAIERGFRLEPTKPSTITL